MSSLYIPPDQLTTEENRVIERIVIETYRTGELETVSSNRTSKIYALALEEGCSIQQAARLTNHFNAATEKLATMSKEERQEYTVALNRALSRYM